VWAQAASVLLVGVLTVAIGYALQINGFFGNFIRSFATIFMHIVRKHLEAFMSFLKSMVCDIGSFITRGFAEIKRMIFG